MSIKKAVSVESLNAKEEVRDLIVGNTNSGLSKSLDPVYRVIKEETVSPRGQLLNLEKGVYNEILYKSTLCMAAEQKSLSGIPFSRIIRKARRTEEAWKRHDRGEFTTMELDDFIKEMKKW